MGGVARPATGHHKDDVKGVGDPNDAEQNRRGDDARNGRQGDVNELTPRRGAVISRPIATCLGAPADR